MNSKSKDGLSETVRYIPFDMTFAKHALPCLKPVSSETPASPNNHDDQIEKLLDDRVKALTATEDEKDYLELMVKMIANVLTELKKFKGDDNDNDRVKVTSYQLIGNYTRGIVFAGNAVAEIVTFLQILPTAVNVEKFSSCIMKCLKNKQDDEAKPEEETKMDPKLFEVKNYEEGFIIVHPRASVKILMTASSNVLSEQRADMNELSVKEPILRLAWFLGPQTDWLDKNASEDIIKNLSRIFQDISKRFVGFKPLTPWIIDNIVVYVVKYNPTGNNLTMAQAFRRFFQVLSAGFFLPESSAILDPCHPTKKPIHFRMTFEEQDKLTTTAQNLLRLICHGGFASIIGSEGNDSLISERSSWDYGKLGSVIVTPLEVEYQKITNIYDEVMK